MITFKITEAQFEEVSKARTKYDMCYEMDRFRFRSLPWLQLVSLSKEELRLQFAIFLGILKLHVEDEK